MKRTITNDWSKSKCESTPFGGTGVARWLMATISRSRVMMMMRDGVLLGSPGGEPVQFDAAGLLRGRRSHH